MFSEKLKNLREEKNLNQKELAKKINLDNTLYNKYENNYNSIPTKHLNNLCNYFNVSADYLLDFTNERHYINSKKEINSNIVGIRIKEFRKENKLTQVKLANFLKTTQSVVSEYESGKCLIIVPFLIEICKKYNISADYLLGKVDYPKYLK